MSGSPGSQEQPKDGGHKDLEAEGGPAATRPSGRPSLSRESVAHYWEDDVFHDHEGVGPELPPQLRQALRRAARGGGGGSTCGSSWEQCMPAADNAPQAPKAVDTEE